MLQKNNNPKAGEGGVSPLGLFTIGKKNGLGAFMRHGGRGSLTAAQPYRASEELYGNRDMVDKFNIDFADVGLQIEVEVNRHLTIGLIDPTAIYAG